MRSRQSPPTRKTALAMSDKRRRCIGLMCARSGGVSPCGLILLWNQSDQAAGFVAFGAQQLSAHIFNAIGIPPVHSCSLNVDKFRQ